MAGLILFALVAYQGWDYGRGSYRTAAIITGKHVFRATSGDAYYVDFRYTDRTGQPHKMSASASQGAYDRAKDGDSIAIYVSANDPSDATLAEEKSAEHFPAGLIAAAGVALFIPGAWLFVRNLRKRAQPTDSEIR